MDHNSDFTERAVVHAADEPWVASPMPGVDRRILDRIGDEVARATSIVRYAPGSKFSSHVHTGGEEFLVLEGVFSDEHGDFPEGSYIRNPPESSHTPRSEEGCTIFVKLWQFDPADRTHVRIDTNKMPKVTEEYDGEEFIPLFDDGNEEVRIEFWPPDGKQHLLSTNGLELLVLDGGFEQGGDTFKKHSWLRLPKGVDRIAKVGSKGARVWIKRGHLKEKPTGPKV